MIKPKETKTLKHWLSIEKLEYSHLKKSTNHEPQSAMAPSCTAKAFVQVLEVFVMLRIDNIGVSQAILDVDSITIISVYVTNLSTPPRRNKFN